MPRSSNPAVLVFAVLYLLMGAFFLAMGVPFLLGFDLWMIIGIPFTLGGISSIVGAYGLAKQWRGSIRAEKDTADFMRRTVASGAALPSDGVLAHWVYDAEQWRAYRKRESAYRRMQAAMWGLLMTVVVTIAGTMASGDLVAGLGIGCVVGALAGGGQWIRAASANRANRSTPLPDVIIGRSSLLFNGRYHVLQDHQYDFGGVRLLENERPLILEFTVTWKTRRGRSDAQIRVPVPRGHEDEARMIIDRFPRVGTTAPALAHAG
jgi:hypothetical protein